MNSILYVKYDLKMDGVTSLFLNMCKNWSSISVDYLLDDDVVSEEVRQAIESRKGKIYCISNRHNIKSKILYRLYKLLYIYKFLKNQKYKIVHIHTEDMGRSLILLVAKLAGVKVRIIHSHNSSSQSSSGLVRRLIKRCMPLFVTHYFTCSDEAAIWMFPNSVIKRRGFKIIHNGIDLERFKYDLSIRKQYRDELHFEDKLIFCTVGRLEKQKNYEYLIEIYFKLCKTLPKSNLLFIGDGSEKKRLEELVSAKGLKDNVLFLGVRDDVQKLLNAADCFILPSFFEGLPVVLVEAQALGLPCFVSDTITKQVALTNNIHYLSIKASPDIWVDKLKQINISERKDRCGDIEKAGFNIKDVTNNLEQFYLSLI